MSDRNTGEYVVHFWFEEAKAMVAGYRLEERHQAQTYRDREINGEFEELLGPAYTEQARDMKPGDSLSWVGGVPSRQVKRITVHKIF